MEIFAEVPEKAPSEILTIKDVALLLKLHEKTIYKMAQQKTLPGIQIGSSWRFSRGEIMKMLKPRK